MSKYLVTGSAGFIGFHLTKELLQRGEEVFGLDCINDYYDVRLKFGRLRELGIPTEEVLDYKVVKSDRFHNFRFLKMTVEDKNSLLKIFSEEKVEYVIHLAAQAGVRYSIDNPDVYIQSNIVGFYNILESCRFFPVKYLLYASSSSVYGNNKKVPFSENDRVDSPISLYAATKKSNELMAYTYNHIFGIPATGLRFFTVYGPWGRPDMAVFKFTEAILRDRPLTVYAEGKLLRDFTYIDDIINGIISILEGLKSNAPGNVMNIGNNNPVTVNELIGEIETCLGKKARIEYQPMQPGDVRVTYADISRINSFSGYRPETSLKDGIASFCKWYLNYLSKDSSLI